MRTTRILVCFFCIALLKLDCVAFVPHDKSLISAGARLKSLSHRLPMQYSPGAHEKNNNLIMVFSVPAKYGYCIFSAATSAAVAKYNSDRIHNIRSQKSKHEAVSMPQSDYSSSPLMLAMQSSLISLPLVLLMLIFGGILAPVPSAILGMVWNVGQAINMLSFQNLRFRLDYSNRKRLAAMFFLLNMLLLGSLGGIGLTNGLKAIPIA
mmetsp:Transcript_17996/g.26203  ORF Transcript_17996/g.26203 Transcript_17996/m.26203 type:complete len:208 (+) Transcript_17996:313-936(+)